MPFSPTSEMVVALFIVLKIRYHSHMLSGQITANSTTSFGGYLDILSRNLICETPSSPIYCGRPFRCANAFTAAQAAPSHQELDNQIVQLPGLILLLCAPHHFKPQRSLSISSPLSVTAQTPPRRTARSSEIVDVVTEEEPDIVLR